MAKSTSAKRAFGWVLTVLPILAIGYCGEARAQCENGPTPVCAWSDTTLYTGSQCYWQGRIPAPQVISNGCPDASTHGCYAIYTATNDTIYAGGTSTILRTGIWLVRCDAYSVNHPEIPVNYCEFSITVLDTSRPVLVSPVPFDLYSTVLPGQCSAAVTFDRPVFDDNCQVETVCIPPPNSPFPVGVTTVVCSAADPSGNVGSVSFKVTVQNFSPPVITCPRDTTIECGSSTDPDGLGWATATASCGVGVNISYEDSEAMFQCGIPHRIDRRWKATDSSGVESTCIQRISIRDTTPPVIVCPASIVVPGTSPQPVNYRVTAWDTCDSHPEVVCTPPSGSSFPVGITTVTCTAEDCDGNTAECSFTVAVAVPVPIDVKPGSCPNPLRVTDQGRIPVAILGTSNFDPSQVDPTSVRMAGVAPAQWSMADVATPFEPYLGRASCTDCTTLKKDRRIDLTLKFNAQEVLRTLRPITNGECRVLTLIGLLNDGTAFVGEDVVRMGGTLGREGEETSTPWFIPSTFGIEGYPNPFNPSATIRFDLPEGSRVKIVVYDILGRTVATIAEGENDAGRYEQLWEGEDDNGRLVSSGMYFVRIEAVSLTSEKRFVAVRKMMLVK